MTPALSYFPALISGLMLTCSFPDPGIYGLAFVALVPFFLSIQTMEKRQAAYAGMVMGLAHTITLIYWIVPTLTTYGGLHPVLSLSALILLCSYLSLFFGGFALAIKSLDPGPVWRPLMGACLWTGLEFIRAHVFTGFPWGLLGYSQTRNLVLIQVADLVGVMGISFLIVLANHSTALVWQYFKLKSLHRPDRRQLAVCMTYTLIFFAGALIYGRARIHEVDRQISSAPKTKIALVQGNIRQDLKWDQAFCQATIDAYGRLSSEGAKAKPDLVVWPETALPFYYGRDLKKSRQVDQIIQNARTHFLIGTPAFERKEEKPIFFNRACMLNRFALKTGYYDKTHLVPFGEYVPLGKYLKFLGKITAQAGDFSPGTTGFTPLKFRANRLENPADYTTGILICFEILFPDLSRKFVKNGADILTTMTNDAWFGRTSAPGQHFSIAVFRAVENRRSCVRVANTGISGFIDPVGRILQKTALFREAVLVKSIPILKENSVYTRYPYLFPLALVVAIIGGFMVKFIKKF